MSTSLLCFTFPFLTQRKTAVILVLRIRKKTREYSQSFPTDQRGDPIDKRYADNWLAVHSRQRMKEAKSSPSILLVFITLSF